MGFYKEIKANDDSYEQHSIYLIEDDGKITLNINGCDCSAEVKNKETAIRMRNLIDEYINQ